MKFYTIKYKLVKFKSGNTINYTLKQEIEWISSVKSFEYNMSYHSQFLDEFGKYHKMTMKILIFS
jgi:hypothetical protein